MEICLECYNYEIGKHNINIPIRINDPPFAVQQLVHKSVNHMLYAYNYAHHHSYNLIIRLIEYI